MRPTFLGFPLSPRHRSWFRFAMQMRGSVLPYVFPRALLCGLFGEVIALLYSQGINVSIPALSGLIPNIVLGLLLVFRTNTAYERFWEGRKLWGTLTNVTRNLARQIWVNVSEKNSQDRTQKAIILHLLVAFAVSTKLHLRKQSFEDPGLLTLLPKDCYFKLQDMNTPPLEIAFWVSDYLQKQRRRNRLTAYQLDTMQKMISTMVDVLGGCERILRTPIPLAYVIHLKQLLLIYCLTLPFQLVADVQWATGPIVALITFTLLGIEEIGVEIENPFGTDANDLPLDAMCQNMLRDVEDLIGLGAAWTPISTLASEAPPPPEKPEEGWLSQQQP
ncbi:MAG: bestrophin family ion channel [Cyanobacteria bacterium J069]|nr:MAG: hypothetical protein D6742_04885 [Cyanobacteria bacterium J069]